MILHSGLYYRVKSHLDKVDDGHCRRIAAGEVGVETRFPYRRERTSMRYPPNLLDADTAEELLRFFDQYPILQVAGFSLWTFDEMTPEAAKVIARSGMDVLFLDSVRGVSPEVIHILVESPVSFLSLGGLEEFSPEVATILSGFRGSCLKLDGVTDLSPEVAAILARYPKLLSLGGIKTLSVESAKALARHRGDLMLDGLIHLPGDLAEALSRHRGTLLTFENLRFLSDGAAMALAGYQGKVEMPLVEANASDNSIKPHA